MLHHYRRLAIACLFPVLVLLASCGHNENNNTTDTGGIIGTPVTATTKNLSPIPLTPGVSPAATTQPVPSATQVSLPQGSVTLHVDASAYRTSDTITATLSNQSNQTISFPDHLTNCTVILLQRLGNSGWESVHECKLMTPTGLYTLKAGQSLTVKLLASPQWIAGRHRVSVGYRIASSEQTAVSAEFQVG